MVQKLAQHFQPQLCGQAQGRSTTQQKMKGVHAEFFSHTNPAAILIQQPGTIHAFWPGI